MLYDDVVMIGDNKNTLQEILNITNSYANIFSLSFNESKCGVLIINKPGGREEFRFGNKVINQINQNNYLRVLFEEGGTGRAKAESIFRAMTKFRSNKYEIARGIFKGVVIPSLLYGMETINWTHLLSSLWFHTSQTVEEINKLEIIQNKIGRLVLGANKWN